MDRETKTTHAALDKAVAQIGDGAWWHGSVDNHGSSAIIELSKEPDETERKWTASTLTDALDAVDVLAIMVEEGDLERFTDLFGVTAYRVPEQARSTLAYRQVFEVRITVTAMRQDQPGEGSD